MDNNAKRITRNTLMLYIRQIVILSVNLYTVRVVLDVLGVEDFGIYSVIGGVVSFFIFISGTMASATQRFFSFAIGENDNLKLKKTFTVNLIIYLSISLVAFILLETIGVWFYDNYLSIPIERFESARLLYHYSVVSFIFIIFQTPFKAIIIAHEDMHLYAIISVVEAVLKLIIVYFLIYYTYDKLTLYGILLMLVSFITAFIYIFICSIKYAECQIRKFYWDKSILKDILGFTGWTLFGQLTTVFRNQGITILLNQYFSPAIVAARAISISVSNQINLFSNNFNVGLYPPIIKAYAANRHNEMFSLIFNGSRITFFLLWIFALPIFIEMEFILDLWLKEPPFFAVIFTRLALIEVLINSLSLPITTAARAPGRMKVYEVTLGILQILLFILSWIVLIIYDDPIIVYAIAIAINVLMFVVRLYIVGKLIDLNVAEFIKKVVLPVFIIITISFSFSYICYLLFNVNALNSILVMAIAIASSCISMYYVGLNGEHREHLKVLVYKKFIG